MVQIREVVMAPQFLVIFPDGTEGLIAASNYETATLSESDAYYLARETALWVKHQQAKN